MNAPVSIALAWLALPLAAALAPSLTAGTAGAAARELGTAPDGHPGFGSAVALADARRVFLSPGDGERALLASLSGLEAEIRILVVAEEVRTAAAGDFDLVPRRAPRTLAVLHEAWFAALEDPLPALAAGGPGARALARTASDVRFRLRAEVLRGIERELRELTGALGVMQASFDGYADLSDAELSAIARRADLAAARQRAVLLDLEALRADEPVEVDPALAGLAERARGARGDAPDRAAADAARASLAALARRVERLADPLFTTRLARKPAMRDGLAWREEVLRRSELAAAGVRALMPDTPEGRAAPGAIAGLSRSERLRQASFAALAALAEDPLHEELNWYAAETLDFLWGLPDSRRFYDRYLALRGIRAHDSRSYRYVDLDDRGKRAVERVQAPFAVVPPR